MCGYQMKPADVAQVGFMIMSHAFEEIVFIASISVFFCLQNIFLLFESLCLRVVWRWRDPAISWTGSVSANSVQTFKTFLFSCCLEQYKLVKLNTTKQFEEVKACRKACWEIGMVLMPLESDEDRKAIVSLQQYNYSSLVITDGIDMLDKSGHSTFFSSPGGRQVYFIHLASTIGKRQSNKAGGYNIVIYHDQYYSRDSVVGKNDECACKVPGEWCLYSGNADIFANKKVPSRLNQVRWPPPVQC